MRKAGFIFSLDAFVAFTLIMVTVSLLIFTISIPRPFYPSLEQAHQLAYDGLFVLSNARATPGSPSSPTYLQEVLSDPASRHRLMVRALGGDPSVSSTPIIPQGYGFRLESRVLGAAVTEWVPIYDSADDPQSDRYGKEFTKIRASATSFLSVYSTEPFRGASPYCYLSCSGYNYNNDPNFVCDNTPCNISISNFLPGQNAIQMVRLVVYA